MFFIFALAVLVLAFIGLGSVLGGSIAALFLLPILLMKVAFFLFLFGFIGRSFAYRGRRPSPWRDGPWQGRRPRRDDEPSQSEDDKFEEWHRVAHAREEVDSWVEDVVGPE